MHHIACDSDYTIVEKIYTSYKALFKTYVRGKFHNLMKSLAFQCDT